MNDYKEYVYAVYQEKSFSRAAQKLYVAQPWLSSVVKKVEKEYGIQIFNRDTSPLTLTEAGASYIESIEQIMQIEKDMRRHFKELNDQNGSALHIGSSMFFCTYVLPVLLADFKALYPQITLSFTEGDSPALFEQLAEQQLDFVLEAELADKSRLQTVPWASEELVLAVPSNFKINESLSDYRYTFEEFRARNESGRKKPPVPLRKFSEESFLLLRKGNDSYKRSSQICENAGFSPKAGLYVTQMMTAYYLVCEGRGVAFLRSTIPEFVTPTNRVYFYRLSDPLAVRTIYLTYLKRQVSPVRQHLIDFMEEQCSLKPA